MALGMMGLALALALEATAAEGPERALGDARRLIAEGKLSEARAALAAVGDDSTEALHLRGVVAYRLREYPTAIAALRHASSREAAGGAEIRESLLLLGQSLFLAGKIPDALAALERASAEGVRANELFYMLAIGYIRTGDADKARRSVASLFLVPAGSPAARLLTAQMMIRLEFEEPALKELQRALELEPSLPGAHYLLGQSHIFRGNIERGIEELTRELAVNPGSSMAYYKMGDAYTRREDWTGRSRSCSARCGSIPTSAGPISCSASRISRRRTFPTPRACCGRRSGSTRRTTRRTTCWDRR
jgi:predicted Zn-dependent protease